MVGWEKKLRRDLKKTTIDALLRNTNVTKEEAERLTVHQEDGKITISWPTGRRTEEALVQAKAEELLGAVDLRSRLLCPKDSLRDLVPLPVPWKGVSDMWSEMIRDIPLHQTPPVCHTLPPPHPLVSLVPPSTHRSWGSMGAMSPFGIDSGKWCR